MTKIPTWPDISFAGRPPLSKDEEDIEQGDNQFKGKQATRRLVVTAGKLGTNDIFDTNAYANSTHTQFMNWALINNPAYDYAADTRGYTQGIAVEWIHPEYTLRFGSFLMPKVANGPELDYQFNDSRGDQLEFETHPKIAPSRERATVRLLAYRNMATMGNYAQSIANAGGGVPDITATRRRGRVKYGFGLNVEQPLGEDGETGLFVRLGWSDGENESYADTEADDHASVGLQLSGRKWHRRGDTLGVAVSSNGLSASHRDYLAAGGVGFVLGDGRLNYGRETLLESYYSHPMSRSSFLTLGTQLIKNPGFNQDRGPVPTMALRLHCKF